MLTNTPTDIDTDNLLTYDINVNGGISFHCIAGVYCKLPSVNFIHSSH
jgi:hypothetical protein